LKLHVAFVLLRSMDYIITLHRLNDGLGGGRSRQVKLAFGCKHLVSAPCPILSDLGSGLPRRYIGTSLNSPTFPSRLSSGGCELSQLPALPLSYRG